MSSLHPLSPVNREGTQRTGQKGSQIIHFVNGQTSARLLQHSDLSGIAELENAIETQVQRDFLAFLLHESQNREANNSPVPGEG
jgi:hypothetical protein